VSGQNNSSEVEVQVFNERMVKLGVINKYPVSYEIKETFDLGPEVLFSRSGPNPFSYIHAIMYYS
jgi:hypothetical protein